MKIVGLDLSLVATGVAIIINGIHQVYTLNNKLTGTERLIAIRDQVLLHCNNADVVVIEGYAFARPNQAHQIGELGGVIRTALHEAGHRYIEVQPTALKKFATGKGGANKIGVAVAIAKRYGVQFKNDNEYDAYGLAQIGLAFTEACQTVFQQEVIDELRGVKVTKKRKKKVS